MVLQFVIIKEIINFNSFNQLIYQSINQSIRSRGSLIYEQVDHESAREKTTYNPNNIFNRSVDEKTISISRGHHRCR